MKSTKHIAVLLAFFLLVSNIGLAFNVHYCGENIASISFDYKTAEPCKPKENRLLKACCVKKNMHGDCCRNSKVDIKKSISDNVIVKNFQLDLSYFTCVELFKSLNNLSLHKSIIAEKKSIFYCHGNAPPFYKLYSQLIFYA